MGLCGVFIAFALSFLIVYGHIKTTMARFFKTSDDIDASLLEEMGILLIKKDGVIVTATESAQSYLGSSHALHGQKIEEFVGELGQSISTWTAAAVSGGAHQDPVLLKLLKKSGEHFVQMVWLSRWSRDGDARYAILFEGSDVKHMQLRIEQNHKMQSVGRLAGGIAHDFNNLITAISGHCDLLLLNRTENDPIYQDLKEISYNSNRAADLITHLLAFSRKQETSPVFICVSDLFRNLSKLLTRLVGEKVILKFHSESEYLCIYIDIAQFEHVLINLVVNARDAMQGEGVIEISARALKKTHPHYHERLVEGCPYVEITVKDTGRGIEKSQFSQIFNPFYTTKSIGEGTGLGLSSVYGIVKQSSGFIFVDSQIGCGTVFTIFLPLHEKAKETTPIKNTLSPFHSKQEDIPQDEKSKILIVEDETPVRHLLKRALLLQNFDVETAESGEEALDLTQTERFKPDLIISDVIMPGLDGPSWVKKFFERNSRCKVIFMSGYAHDQIHAEREKIESAAFLQKPFSLPDLTKLIHNQLDFPKEL